MKPFQQGRFEDLPAQPRVAHPYFALDAETLEVRSRDFGRVGIHVRSCGEGPPLLLVHGLMTTGYSFRYVAEPLGERYQVLIPDLVGCGRSDKPLANYSAAALARFLCDLIAALDARGCRVVGNSLGGYLSMRAALEDEGVMGALVNIHSPGFADRRLRMLGAVFGVPGSRGLLHRLITRDPLEWAFKNVHYRDESLKSLEEAREYGGPLAEDDGREAFVRYLTDTLAPRGFDEFEAALRSRARFPIPLRLLYAREDPMVPPDVGPRLAALVPDAELVWLDDASHFAQVDAPDRLVEEIHRFFDE